MPLHSAAHEVYWQSCYIAESWPPRIEIMMRFLSLCNQPGRTIPRSERRLKRISVRQCVSF